jgi:two-component system, NarL family, response regulator DevR
MSIKVLLADGNVVMRPVIAKVLREEPAVELVGEATSFAETLEMTAALKPDVLLLELHFEDEREYPAGVVKAHVLLYAKCVLALSLWNDMEARDLAESLGAAVLLDKAKLYSELIPAIKRFCPKVTVLKTTKHTVKELNQAPTLQKATTESSLVSR